MKHKDQENKSSIRMITLRPSEDLDTLRIIPLSGIEPRTSSGHMYTYIYIATHYA